MKMKRLISIALILLLLFSLASCSTISGDKPDDIGNSEKIQETQTVEEIPDIIQADEKEVVEEEVEEENSDDLPFMRLLKSGEFYYEVVEKYLETGEEIGAWYIARIGDIECHGTYSEYRGNSRYIDNNSTGIVFDVYDDSKQYEESLCPSMPLRDYNTYQAIDIGMEEVLGEMWEFIDYSTSSGSTRRYYLKDGDIYAYLRTDYHGKLIVGYYLNTADNPSPDYFDIPPDYEFIEQVIPRSN